MPRRSTYRGDRSHPESPLPPYYATILKCFEHTELHLRLKQLVAKDGGNVIVETGREPRWVSATKVSEKWPVQTRWQQG